jgi:hypothetical protein
LNDREGAAYARLAAVRARLDQPPPPALEGQETIDLAPRYEQPTLDEGDRT